MGVSQVRQWNPLHVVAMENPREFTEDMKGFTLQFWNLI
jgi:hypothetical protein